MNKILLKICGIISLIYAFLFFFLFVIGNILIPFYRSDFEMYHYIPLVGVALFSLVTAFGGLLFLHYHKLPDKEINEKKNTILIWSIIFFFTTWICGIISFIVYLSLSNIFTSNQRKNYLEEIKELKEMLDDGLITEKEFESKKKKLLDI